MDLADFPKLATDIKDGTHHSGIPTSTTLDNIWTRRPKINSKPVHVQDRVNVRIQVQASTAQEVSTQDRGQKQDDYPALISTSRHSSEKKNDVWRKVPEEVFSSAKTHIVQTKNAVQPKNVVPNIASRTASKDKMSDMLETISANITNIVKNVRMTRVEPRLPFVGLICAPRFVNTYIHNNSYLAEIVMHLDGRNTMKDTPPFEIFLKLNRNGSYLVQVREVYRDSVVVSQEKRWMSRDGVMLSGHRLVEITWH